MSEELPKLTSIKDLKGVSRDDLRDVMEGMSLLEEINSHLWHQLNGTAHRSSGYYSPSSLPYCARAMYYQRIGVEQRNIILPGTRIIFDVGHAVHDTIQGYITGALGEDVFQIEVPCVDEELHIKGSADGVLDLDTERRLLEIKSISTKAFPSLASPKQEHLLQAHCYAYMLDTPLMWFLYYDKNNGSMKVFDVTFDKKIWGKALDKLERIERCVQKENPPPYEVGWGCKECKFRWHCQPPEG